MQTSPAVRSPLGRPPARLTTALALALTAAATASAQTDYYWNGADISASPAAGGTGIWSATNAWRTVSDTGTQGTWAAGAGNTNNAILAGAAGTLTLGTSGSTNFTGANLTASSSGYTITSSSGSRNLVFTGTLSLANNVALTLDQNNTGATWAFGSMSLGTGATLTLQGIATASNANRINLTAANGTSSGGSITLAGAAAGPTGFVATASGVSLNSHITNNSTTSATMLGATSGNSLSFGGVLSGSAHLQISAGQSGGAGVVTLANVNTYTGNTYLNTGSNAVTRIGVNNALPAGTTVFFGQSAGGGTADNGGSIDLNGRDLHVGALDAASSGRGVANNTATLNLPASLSLGLSNLAEGSFSLFGGASVSGSFTSVQIGALTLDGGNGFFASDGAYNFSFNTATNSLGITAVPEPSAFAALAGLATLGFAATRRRRA
jgi:hypothetical protein